MQALIRLETVPPLVIVLFVLLALFIAGWVTMRRRAGERANQQALRRMRREMGYGWAWREFWFAPRQPKLPPPPKKRAD